MKAKDLTQADVGKWVMARAQIVSILDGRPYAQFEGDDHGLLYHEAIFPSDATLEFTDPPAPVQEVGDVFRSDVDGHEWEIAAISDAAGGCLMARVSGMKDLRAAPYPVISAFWTLVRKGIKP